MESVIADFMPWVCAVALPSVGAKRESTSADAALGCASTGLAHHLGAGAAPARRRCPQIRAQRQDLARAAKVQLLRRAPVAPGALLAAAVRIRTLSPSTMPSGGLTITRSSAWMPDESSTVLP